MKAGYWRAVAPLILGSLIALFPAPAGLGRSAWFFFAIFAATIMGLILEPMPPAAIGFVGVFLVAVLGLLGSPAESIRWALAGFSNTTVWLIFGAFMFALGYEKTGLGKRIGLLLVRILGRRTLGLGYAVAFTDLILAPFTPSNTARSCGAIFPVIRSLPGLYGSFPGETARRIGAYIMWTAFASTCVTSSMFLTALAPNLLAIELIQKTSMVAISWTDWLLGFLPAGIILILILPYLVYKIYPPEVKVALEVPSWASRELAKLGPFSSKEATMGVLVVLALAAWIFGAERIDATTVAGVVIALMVITGVVSWEDISANRQAWNVLVWFAMLVTLADGLNKVGFIGWFATHIAALIAGWSPLLVMILFVAIFFTTHYLFASLTAHTTAILPVIFAAGIEVPGLPLRTFALLLCFSLGLMGVITPYATGPAPVYFSSGYISRSYFWKLGAIFGAIFLVVLLAVGVPYLLLIGK